MKIKGTLINPPWEDPALLLEPDNLGEHWLADCGNIEKMRIRDVQKVKRAFISHGHIDHFYGFDRLMRMQLRENTRLTVYGPEPIIAMVKSRLNGYVWNLVDENRFYIDVVQIGQEHLTTATFASSEAFAMSGLREHPLPEHIDLPGNIALRWAYGIHGDNLNCLSFSWQTPEELTVNKEALAASPYRPGPWLSVLKRLTSADPSTELDIYGEQVPLSALSDMVTRHPGCLYAYIADSMFNKVSAARFKKLIYGAQCLWCECSYLNTQLDLARRNQHFTARQVARMAYENQVKSLVLYHYSRRFKDQLMAHIEEARQVFPNTLEPEIYQG